MDENKNEQATRLLRDLADRFGWEVRPMRIRYSDGTDGYSAQLRQPGDHYLHRNPVVVTFHNDGEFGPRWGGLAGASVPAPKVIPYVTAFAEDTDVHPMALNAMLVR